MIELNLSARACDRILKVARMVADLEASREIAAEHVGRKKDAKRVAHCFVTFGWGAMRGQSRVRALSDPVIILDTGRTPLIHFRSGDY